MSNIHVENFFPDLQGLKCDICDQNYHKKCIIKIPNDCRIKRDSETESGRLSSNSNVSSNSVGTGGEEPEDG